MSKTKAVLREVYERRAIMLKMINKTPMSSYEIATQTGKKLAEISNDLSNMSRQGLVKLVGKKRAKNARGDTRFVSLWGSLSTPDADEIESLSYFKKEEKIHIPELPKNILLMMGYTSHKPEGGRIINNEHFHQPHNLSRVKVNIGNHWGIMMEASL